MPIYRLELTTTEGKTSTYFEAADDEAAKADFARWCEAARDREIVDNLESARFRRMTIGPIAQNGIVMTDGGRTIQECNFIKAKYESDRDRLFRGDLKVPPVAEAACG